MLDINHADIARYPASLQSAARAVFGTAPRPLSDANPNPEAVRSSWPARRPTA